jgi:predicted PurR-regulated permease PerM
LPRVERTLIVQAPVDRVYLWWARWENLPAVMPRLRQVTRTGPLTTHWKAEAADGTPVEWDTVITQDLPQRQLAWESKAGPVRLKGQVEFEALSGDRTRLHLILSEEGTTGPLLLEDFDAALAAFQATIEGGPAVPPLPVAYPYRDLFYKAMSATAGVLLVAGVAWGLLSLVEVWMIVLGALLVSATLSPAVAFLMRLRMPRLLAVAVTFLTVLAGLTIVFVVLIPGIMVQGQELAAKLPAYAGELQAYLTQLNAKHPSIPAGTQVMGFLGEQASVVLGNAFSLTTRFIWLLVVVLSIMFLSLFMLIDGARLQDALMRLVPIPQKSHMPALIHTVQERVGQYMLGVAFICGLAGVLTWAALALMGVPYALLIGASTTLLQVVPFVGPLFGAAIAGAIGLSKSPETAVWTLAVYGVIQQVIGQFLFPLIMGRTIGMHPVWVMVAILVGGTLYGLVGAFVAIPIAIAISIVLECYYVPWAEARAAEGTP